MAKDRRVPEEAPIVRFAKPFQEFLESSVASGSLLLGCAIAALAWANSPYQQQYYDLFHAKIGIAVAGHGLYHSFAHWINDGLMAIFFLLVGLEIKREFLVGELSQKRKAALPIAAAIGGVVVPALIYVAINQGGPGKGGWGIPMATDIAFAIGIMAMLGNRVPLSLKIFLTALAIVDDIVAVLVIAVFYSSGVSWIALGAAAVIYAGVIGLNLLEVRNPLAYAIGGLFLWAAFLESGVHATIAGVLLAFAVPSAVRIDRDEFLARTRAVIEEFAYASKSREHVLRSDAQQASLQALENLSQEIQPPLHQIEHALHPWVNFLIVPLFALANAGVTLTGGMELTHPITLGVALGLIIGKPLGITLAAWMAVRLGMAALPVRVKWANVHGVAWLGGIGFTMSLFIAGLAFPDDGGLAPAKVGILAGSLASGTVGALLLSLTPVRPGVEVVGEDAPPLGEHTPR